MRWSNSRDGRSGGGGFLLSYRAARAATRTVVALLLLLPLMPLLLLLLALLAPTGCSTHALPEVPACACACAMPRMVASRCGPSSPSQPLDSYGQCLQR